TTYGAPNASSARATSSSVVHTYAIAVGTFALAMTSLANALEPSSRAASALGPKHGMPAARTASATPATSGASGPTTTSSAPCSTASAATASGSSGSTDRLVAICAVPGFPGATRTSWAVESEVRARAMACSRAPDPTTRIFTSRKPTDWSGCAVGSVHGPDPGGENSPRPGPSRPRGPPPVGDRVPGMRTHASMTGPSRARRGLTALLLLPLLLVLAGCFRLDMALTINEDETLDVAMEIADRTGMATRDDLNCADLESEITDAPWEAEFTGTAIEDEAGIGCRMEATGSPIDSMTGEGMTIEKVDDTFVFTFEGDAAGMDTGSLEDMPAGMEPDVSISVTFPRRVSEADGEVARDTVTATGIEAFSSGGTATGEASGSGAAGGVDTWVWVVLGVVALAAIAALVYFISK